MQKKTRSLLEELELIGAKRDIKHVVENRANNIITSAINLLELMQRHYDQETVEILEKKLLNAVKNRDPVKFSKHLKRIEKL